MKTKLLALALGLSLASSAVLACPTEQFQRQSGNFTWMANGQFNGQPFTARGDSLRDLRAFLVQFRGTKKRAKGGDGDRGHNRPPRRPVPVHVRERSRSMFVPVVGTSAN